MFKFDGTEQEIGRGAQAVVYSYQGYAYKIFKEEYPIEWIQYEYDIHNEIAKTTLPIARYHPTEHSRQIKMDLIQGKPLLQRALEDGYDHGLEDMIEIHKEIHKFNGLSLEKFTVSAERDVAGINQSQTVKDRVLDYIREIPEIDNLLHLDFHFLNILYTKKGYRVIDWMNAKLGNPIYDYARSYVILNEVAPPLAEKYLLLLREDQMDFSYMDKAIYVMAVLRLNEVQHDNTIHIIDDWNVLCSKSESNNI